MEATTSDKQSTWRVTDHPSAVGEVWHHGSFEWRATREVLMNDRARWSDRVRVVPSYHVLTTGAKASIGTNKRQE